MRKLFATFALAAPLLAQVREPAGPPTEIIGPGKGETYRYGFGAFGGYLMSKGLVDGGAGLGGGAMAVGVFYQPATIIILADAYSGNGKMGAALGARVRPNLYTSKGESFFLNFAIGFGLHLTPTFFASESYDPSGMSAELSIGLDAERKVTDEVSLWFAANYGFVTTSGAPNFISATVGFMSYGK